MNWNPKRKIIQIISLILAFGGFLGIAVMHLIYPFIHCYACPLSIAGCPIGLLQRFVTLGQVPWYPLGAVTIYGLTLGRAFCGWVCPFGLLQDIVGKITGKKMNINKNIHNKAKYFKFFLLIAIVFLAWLAADVLFCKVCPVGTTEAAIPYNIQNRLGVTFFTLGKLGILIALLVFVFLITRFWCRYLCPFGAWLGGFSKASFLQMNVNLEKCNQCGTCEEVCPMAIKSTEIEESMECIKCGKCIDECENDAISYGTPMN